MIIKGVTYVSRQVSTMCLCQTGFPVHAVIVNGSRNADENGAVAYHRVDGKPSTLRKDMRVMLVSTYVVLRRTLRNHALVGRRPVQDTGRHAALHASRHRPVGQRIHRRSHNETSN